MKTNPIYRAMYGRPRSIIISVLGVFAYFSAIPRIVMEVFLRKNFGVRHFYLATAIIVGWMLVVIPMQGAMTMGHSRNDASMDFLKSYATWFIFIAVFLWRSWQHFKAKQAEKRKGFSYDKISSYEGDVLPILWRLKINGKAVTPRQIECFIEPAIFLIPGLLLALAGQMVGWLFVVSSILYSLSYIALYVAGDMMIYDYIDSKIYTAQIKKAFVEDKHPAETMGVVFRGEKPDDPLTRAEVIDSMTDRHDIYTVA